MSIENCEKQKSVWTLQWRPLDWIYLILDSGIHECMISKIVQNSQILGMLKILGNHLSPNSTEFISYLHELRFCCTKEQKVANDYKISQKWLITVLSSGPCLLYNQFLIMMKKLVNKQIALVPQFLWCRLFFCIRYNKFSLVSINMFSASSLSDK